jgi:hypothetical protein
VGEHRSQARQPVPRFIHPRPMSGRPSVPWSVRGRIPDRGDRCREQSRRCRRRASGREGGVSAVRPRGREAVAPNAYNRPRSRSPRGAWSAIRVVVAPRGRTGSERPLSGARCAPPPRHASHTIGCSSAVRRRTLTTTRRPRSPRHIAPLPPATGQSPGREAPYGSCSPPFLRPRAKPERHKTRSDP